MRLGTEAIRFARSHLGFRISAEPTRYSRRRRPLPLVKKTGSSFYGLGFRYRVRDRFKPLEDPKNLECRSVKFRVPTTTPAEKIH